MFSSILKLGYNSFRIRFDSNHRLASLQISVYLEILANYRLRHARIITIVADLRFNGINIKQTKSNRNEIGSMSRLLQPFNIHDMTITNFGAIYYLNHILTLISNLTR